MAGETHSNLIYNVTFIPFICDIQAHGEVHRAPTCCERAPGAVDSEVRWRCELAASASVCQGAVCARAALGGTRPHPPGRQVVLLALPPPELPVGLEGRLGGENETLVDKFEVHMCYAIHPSAALNPVYARAFMYHIPCNCRWWGSQARRGGVPRSRAGCVIGLHLHPSSLLKGSPAKQQEIKVLER